MQSAESYSAATELGGRRPQLPSYQLLEQRNSGMERSSGVINWGKAEGNCA